MKKKKINKKKLIILLIIIFIIILESYNILINLLFYFNKYKINNNILLEIDTTILNKIQGGPGSFLRGINEIIPFSTNKCNFIPSSIINFIFNIDYYYFTFPQFKESQFEKLVKSKIINKYILGPVFVPKKWEFFPDFNEWEENRFSEILNLTKAIAVHSKRVMNYLSLRSNTTYNIDKFKIIRACSNLKPKKVKQWNERKIDIIFFEKYADFNHSIQGEKLFALFNKTKKKIVSIKYGSYNKKILKKLANNSKFIIYFSFYDTGAIGLKEIQNFGVISFVHQEDLIINNETCFLIPELANFHNMKPAFEKIMSTIEIISTKCPDCELIANKNQYANNCQNSLRDFCKNLF